MTETADQPRGLQRFPTGIVAASERLDLFLAALFTRLQELEVTTICSVEQPALFGASVELTASASGLTDIVDNLLLLRYVELQSQLYRLISILKMRESGYDSAIREFRITNQGIDVAPTFGSAQAILTGVALASHPQRPPTAFGAEDEPGEGGQP